MPARNAYAIILLTRNEPQAALRHLERLLQQAPDCGLFRSMRAAARLQVGDYDQALEDFTAALDQNSGPAAGLDELRPCAANGRPSGGKRRRLPPQPRARTDPGRGLLEPRQPQGGQVRPGRPRGHGDGPGRRRRERRRSRPPAFRARQGAGGRRPLRSRLRTLCRGQCAAPGHVALRLDGEPRLRAPHDADLHRNLPGQAQRVRLPGAGSDLCRRPAAVRLHPGRADPLQPLPGRGRVRVAGPDVDRRPAGRQRDPAVSIAPRKRPACTTRRCSRP